jgi:hypothetical protein
MAKAAFAGLGFLHYVSLSDTSTINAKEGNDTITRHSLQPALLLLNTGPTHLNL